jgi:hypothetical protein
MPMCRCETYAVEDSGVLSWAAVCLMCFVAGLGLGVYLLGVYLPPKKSSEKHKTRTAWTQTVGARVPSAETAMEGTGEVDPMHCAPAAAADDASQADDSNCRGAQESDGRVMGNSRRVWDCNHDQPLESNEVAAAMRAHTRSHVSAGACDAAKSDPASGSDEASGSGVGDSEEAAALPLALHRLAVEADPAAAARVRTESESAPVVLVSSCDEEEVDVKEAAVDKARKSSSQ